jgi:hypothetical protein
MFSFNKRTPAEREAAKVQAVAAEAAKKAAYDARPNVMAARSIKDAEARFGELKAAWWQIRKDVLATKVVDRPLEEEIFTYLRKLTPDDQRIFDEILNNILTFNNQRVVAAYLKTGNNLKLHVRRELLNTALQTPGIDDQVKKVITFFIEERPPFDPGATNAGFGDMSFLNEDEEDEEEEDEEEEEKEKPVVHVPIIREAECGDKQVNDKLNSWIERGVLPNRTEFKALYRALVCIKAVNCPGDLVEFVNKKGKLIYLDEEDNMARGEIKVTPPTPEVAGGRRRYKGTQKRRRNMRKNKSRRR